MYASGTTIRVPSQVFDDRHFQTELANFLSLPGKVDSDHPNVPVDHPDYITALLTGILRSIGDVIGAPCILKCARDEVGKCWEGEWRRSSLWFLIRIAIQTLLDRSSLGRASYKAFILFFVCSLAMDAHNAGFPSNLLYLMSAKILRRLSKLGPPAPDWLSDMALKTCTRLQDTLDVRTMEMQAAKLPSSHWNPSELDLAGDTQLSLPHGCEYIRTALANLCQRPSVALFHPKDYHQGTLEDFLSSDTTLFDKAYSADPYVALYDLERSVEQGIDLWITNVTNVEEACTRLGTLMDIYLSSALASYTDNPEYRSIMALTAIELWVALDKLVIGEISMLAEYSPEIPMSLLESLLLRETTNLHRLWRAYQYLFARHSRSRAGFSVLSNEFSEDSFPVRYYDRSPDLQDLKGRMMVETGWGVAKDGELPERGAASLAPAFREYGPRHKDDGAKAVTSRAPTSPLHSKVVVFELKSPVPFRIWRSAIAHLLYRFDKDKAHRINPEEKPPDLLPDVPEMQPYIIQHPRQESPTYSHCHLAYFHPGPLDSPKDPRLGYVFKWFSSRNEPSNWWKIEDVGPLSQNVTYYNFFNGSGDRGHSFASLGEKTSYLAKYVGSTTHTANDVMSAQDNCPPYFSPDEFIAFGQLRSGGSLQWFNILGELRSRVLNFRSHEVCFLVAQATSQVGPLDAQTGEWVWHQELQNPAFCNVLLNELESLFIDLSCASLDDVSTRTISLLLIRVLASSASEDVSGRAFRLLRSVRRKTLEWTKELAYNLIKAPMNRERCRRLCNMAATCQSTFDVGASSLRKVLHSAEDVEALLSCAFFIQATNQVFKAETCNHPNSCSGLCIFPSNLCNYSGLHHQRHRRLSVTLEGVLRDVIQADVSDRGIDLAVRNIWPGYQPGPQRWKSEEHPNSHWLVSTTAVAVNRPSYIVHINLLDGSLLVDGRPLGGLPHNILEHPVYKQIFHGVCTCQIFRCVDKQLIAFRSNLSLSFHPIFREWILQPLPWSQTTA